MAFQSTTCGELGKIVPRTAKVSTDGDLTDLHSVLLGCPAVDIRVRVLVPALALAQVRIRARSCSTCSSGRFF